jgi:hypothetical protein
MKNLCNQLSYYKNRLSLSLKQKNVTVMDEGTQSFDSLVDQIEKAFGLIKGAHPSTKATKLFELISAGLLFNGEGITILEGMHRDYIRNTISAWKLVYASNMSPAGSFWTATVSGLTEFFDSPQSENAAESKTKKGYSHRHQKLVENVRHYTTMPSVELD